MGGRNVREVRGREGEGDRRTSTFCEVRKVRSVTEAVTTPGHQRTKQKKVHFCGSLRSNATHCRQFVGDSVPEVEGGV
jgi:hypothetical protein